MNSEHRAHVWVGRFSSEPDLNSYFREQYDSDEGPLNQFCADQNIQWYDHDWAEHIFHGEVTALNAVMSHGYFSSALGEVQETISAVKPGTINSSIILLNNQLKTGREVTRSTYYLHYLGCFNADL